MLGPRPPHPRMTRDTFCSPFDDRPRWIVAGSIFVVGLAEREAGLSAAILSITLFTFYFTGQLIGRPFEERR